jgi:hypothetical protein
VVEKSLAEAAAHSGWIGHLVGIDCPSPGAQTQAQVDWHPAQPALVQDIAGPGYFPTSVRVRAVTSISIFMRGSASPALIIVAAGRIAPK